MKKLNLLISMILVLVFSANAEIINTKLQQGYSPFSSKKDVLRADLILNDNALQRFSGLTICSLNFQDRDTNPNSTGFFDQYRREYKGDPNRIKAKKAKVQTEKIEETLEEKRQRLLRELDNIEAENKNDVKNYERLQEKKEEVRSKIDEAELLNKRRRRRQVDSSYDDDYSSVRRSDSRVRRRSESDNSRTVRRRTADSYYDDDYYRY